MKNNISPETIEKWLTGWSLSRGLPAPSRFRSGFKVNVGYEDQKSRYVFNEINDDFIWLSKSIDEPLVFLKVCAPIETVRSLVPDKWEIRPQGYMMSCLGEMKIVQTGLPHNYKLEFETNNSIFIVRIISTNNELASIGRVILVEDIAIYDRILTEGNYTRNGFASIIMRELQKIALSKGIFKNFLVATGEGKELYKSLGWEVDSFYTSIVIPKRNPLIHNK